MNKLKLGIQGGACFVIGTLILLNNPLFFSSKTLQEQVKREDDIWNVVSFAAGKASAIAESSDLAADFFYLQDAHRSARFFAPRLKFDLKKKWASEAINLGIQAASKSSPISDGKSIYIGSDTSWFYCYDLEGKLRWKFYLGNANGGIHSTALVDNEAVYIGSSRGAFYKINKYTGGLIWMRVLGQGIWASPLSVGEDIILTEETRQNNGYLVRIEKKSGQIVWRSDLLGGQSRSSVVYDRETDLLYFGVNNSTIQAIAFKTGRNVFSGPVHGAVASAPVAESGDVYFTSWERDVVSLKMATGATNWNAQLDARSQASPVVLRRAKLLVTADSEGQIYAFGLKSGQLRWKKQFNGDPTYVQTSHLIVLYDGVGSERILFQCKQSFLCLVDETGKLVKSWAVDRVVSGVPFWGGSFLVLSHEEKGLEFLSVLD